MVICTRSPLILRGVLAFCLSFVMALALAPNALAGPQPHIFRLPNGLTVLVREDGRFPLASVRLYVKAGSAWERPEEAGTSHLLEHMVFKGSRTRAEGVDAMVENAGGYLNASTSYDTTIYLTDLPAAQWKVAMEAVRDLAFDPLLRQEELDAEREVVLAEKRQRGDSPYTCLFQALMATTLAGTPYERPVIGTEEALRAATPESIRAYIERRYDPRDMLLVVAGDVRAADVLAEAERLFGGYTNHNTAEAGERVDAASLAHGLKVEVIKGPWNKAYVGVAFPMPGAGWARMPAADVLARMLAGDDTALLPRALRLEKPLVDDISASASSFERAGVFLIVAQMDADRLEAFLGELTGILGRLSASDFSDQEFERAKLNLEDNFLRGQETVAGIADTAGDLYFFDSSDPDGSAYLQSIRDVSRDAVQGVISEWLRPDAMTVTALTPETARVRERDLSALIRKAWPGTDGGSGKAGAAPRAKREDTAGLSKADVVRLGRGRTLVLLPDASLPYVSATLTYPGGALLLSDVQAAVGVNEPARSLEGLGEVTASMLTSGTADRSYADINVFLADRAAGIGAGSAFLDFTVNLDAPSRYAEDVFQLMRDMIVSPAFRQSDLDRVKREQTAAVVSAEENASGLLSRHIRSFLFPGSVYGHTPGGTPESVAGLTVDDVAAFWARQSAQPWVLSVAGDFDRDKVLAFARSLPVPSADRVTADEPGWTDRHELALTLPGREQAMYLMLFPTVPVSHQDSAALSLLSACLDGFGGMLFEELREKRSLGYSVSPMPWNGEHAGFLGFAIVAAPENLAEAKAGFADIARRLREEPLPEETLDRAKAMLEADYYRAQQRRASRARLAASQTLYGRPTDFMARRLERIKALTPDDLLAVARTYLDPAKAYDLRVTP